MNGFPQALETTADEIVRYLEAHPRATDTAEGVVQWWLAGHEFALPLEHVRAALERLVATGAVARRTLPDGTVMYGTNARRS
jgi:hypothetical protein